MHQGLLQEVREVYDTTLDGTNKAGTTFERHIQLQLPLFLTAEVWRRHQYSLHDVRTTLNYFSPMHLWQCCLLYGMLPSNSAIKLAFCAPESMTYGSKAIAIRKIEKTIGNEFLDRPNVLDVQREDHVPPLPLHEIDNWNQLYALLPHTNVRLLGRLQFSESFPWRGIELVPLWLEKGAIYAVRVVSKTTFQESHRVKRDSLSTRPLQIFIGNHEYCGVEEACFFVPSKIGD